MNTRIMYNKYKEAVRLANQKQRFQKLAEVSPDAATHYASWERKELNLEQALSQTVKGLTEHCYKLLQPIPANFLVTFGNHSDFVDGISKKSSYSLLEKAELLTKYLTCLSDIVAYGEFESPSLAIKGERSK